MFTYHKIFAKNNWFLFYYYLKLGIIMIKNVMINIKSKYVWKRNDMISHSNKGPSNILALMWLNEEKNWKKKIVSLFKSILRNKSRIHNLNIFFITHFKNILESLDLWSVSK